MKLQSTAKLLRIDNKQPRRKQRKTHNPADLCGITLIL